MCNDHFDIRHSLFDILRFDVNLPAESPSFPALTVMPPELGQAVVTNTDGESTALSIVEIDSASGAGPVGIELDSILCEANTIPTTGIDLGAVWPALWPSKFGRIGLKVDMRK